MKTTVYNFHSTGTASTINWGSEQVVKSGIIRSIYFSVGSIAGAAVGQTQIDVCLNQPAGGAALLSSSEGRFPLLLAMHLHVSAETSLMGRYSFSFVGGLHIPTQAGDLINVGDALVGTAAGSIRKFVQVYVDENS